MTATPRLSLPKVAVVGVGAVGMAFAYGAAMRGLAREIVLMDIDKERAAGEAMDLSHATAYSRSVTITSAGVTPEDYDTACRGADIVIVTAGKAQKPGQSRMELLQENAGIITSIVKDIQKVSPTPIIIIVTNPVDVMTAVAVQASTLAPGHVFGSGTVLDTGRFRRQLANLCAVDVKSVHAHVLGEHGDSEVCVWSRANVSNVPLEHFCQQRGIVIDDATRQRIDTDVRRAAYEIIDRKGATAYGIGASLCRILEGIIRDSKTILTVSAPAKGLHGLDDDVCISLPCVIGASGVEQALETPLAEAELAALQKSGAVIHEAMTSLKGA